MFLALRDLRHATGRFGLMVAVLVLMTFLVTFLAALTAGLARASTGALTGLPADRVALTTPGGGDPSLTRSQVTPDQRDGWARADGVRRAELLGVATVRATAAQGTTTAVTTFGVEPGSQLLPGGASAPEDGHVVLSTGAARALGVPDGARDADVDVAGTRLHATVLDADAELSHTPVVWTSLADWQHWGATGGGTHDVATVVALWTAPGTSQATVAADAQATGTVALTLRDARSAVDSFTAENLSLTTMQAFLLAISALVVGAFFTVWTINRAGDLAVLKALGAGTGTLVRDALGQALVVLLVGVGVGCLLATGAATLAAGAVPVVVAPSTVLLPALALLVLGLVGAAAATVRIGAVDPHAALAAR